uniref:Uncharacterized protein n=1 Tax=Anguilla anguilla TaxID=7936 RepID=A0A0E9X981_ANGAN
MIFIKIYFNNYYLFCLSINVLCLYKCYI